MDKFAGLTGRQYKLFEYEGAPDAERVVIVMGSGGEVISETVKKLVKRAGEKVGVMKVRLYRPFSLDHFIAELPTSVKAIAVLDRTKELGSLGEPLYMDVVTALAEAKQAGTRPTAADPVVIGGRYGLSSKEFNSSMAKAVFDELKKDSIRSRTSPSASPTTSPTCRSNPTSASTPSLPRASSGRCSSVWVRTAPSAPTRTRSRSSPSIPTTGPRATSCTTRRRPVR